MGFISSMKSGTGLNQAVDGVINYNYGALAQQAITVMWIVFGLGVVIAGAFLFKRYIRDFKDKAMVFIRKGGNIVDMRFDSVKVIARDAQGKPKLDLLKLNKTCPVPANKFRYKFGKKDLYLLMLDDGLDLHPCEVENEPDVKIEPKGRFATLLSQFAPTPYDGTLRPMEFGEAPEHLKKFINPVPADVKAWNRNERQSIELRVKQRSFLSQHLPEIIMIGTATLMFLIFYFGFQALKEGLLGVAGSLGQVATSCVR